MFSKGSLLSLLVRFSIYLQRMYHLKSATDSDGNFVFHHSLDSTGVRTLLWPLAGCDEGHTDRLGSPNLISRTHSDYTIPGWVFSRLNNQFDKVH